MGQGRLFATVLTVSILGLAGCGSGDDTARWRQYPVVIYAEPALAGNSAADADFRTAVAFWEARAGKPLFEYRGAWTGGTPYDGNPVSPSAIFANVVFTLNPWSFAANTVGQTVVNMDDDRKIEASLIMINPGTRFCTGDCTGGGGGSNTSLRKLLAHELGHFLGLAHTGSVNDIMYPDLQPGASLANVTVDMDSLHEVTKDED